MRPRGACEKRSNLLFFASIPWVLSPGESVWVAVAAAGLAGAGGGLWWARSVRRRRLRRHRLRGVRGEARALRMLRRAGYRLVATQASGLVEVVVDGERRTYPVRADALLQRRERRYLAEIKTGRAGSLADRATRRQLLEYACAFEVDGILLVDADRRRIRMVEFPGAPGARAGGR